MGLLAQNEVPEIESTLSSAKKSLLFLCYFSIEFLIVSNLGMNKFQTQVRNSKSHKKVLNKLWNIISYSTNSNSFAISLNMWSLFRLQRCSPVYPFSCTPFISTNVSFLDCYWSLKFYLIKFDAYLTSIFVSKVCVLYVRFHTASKITHESVPVFEPWYQIWSNMYLQD